MRTKANPTNTPATHSRSECRRRRLRPGPAAGLATVAVAALALAACDASEATGADSDNRTESSAETWRAADSGPSVVLFLGDSVAAGQAVALRQGLAESGVKFVDATSTGGGNVVGPNAAEQWKTLPETVQPAENGVVIYQITSYDWGTAEEQRAAYERLARTTTELDADLLLVSMPPIRPDEFYQPHMDELATADDAARQVANELDGVEYLDAMEVWGSEYARERDGTVDRSEDGIHTCPQGAARFTSWMLDQLAELDPDFTPADADIWANTGWADDSEKFHGC